MTLLLFILGIVGFIYLYGKIGTLEDQIATLKGTARPSAPSPHQQSQPMAPAPAPQPVAQIRPQPVKSFGEAESGKWLGKIGIGAIFIGVAFFLKYAFDNNLIGPLGRVLIGFVIGAGLIAFGWYLRKKYTQFAYVLMGGGVAILYLTFFAAYSFYNLVSEPVAFALMIMTTLVTVMLGLLDDSLALVILAVVGGFATPFFFASSQNPMPLLFIYVTVLDIGSIALALRNKWFPIAYIAMAGTLIQFLAWFSVYYSFDQLWITVFFLTVFYLIFLSFTVLRNIWKREMSNGADLTLITINALGYFLIVYNLFTQQQLAIGDITWCVSFILAAVYFAVAYGVYSLHTEDRALSAYTAALGTLFLTLTIPLKLHDSWITVAWLLEAAILFGMGFYLRRESLHIYGLIVYLIALIKLTSDYLFYFAHSSYAPNEYMPFTNQYFALFVVAIVIAYALSYFYMKSPDAVMNTRSSTLASLFLVAANILTLGIITSEISGVYTKTIALNYMDMESATSLRNQEDTIISIFWTIYSLALIAVGFFFRNKVFRIMGLILFFVTAFKIFIDVWNYGPVYRIVSSIIFGVVALAASFVYAKYKDTIQEMMGE